MLRTMVIIPIPVKLNCSVVDWRESSLRALEANATVIIESAVPTPIIR